MRRCYRYEYTYMVYIYGIVLTNKCLPAKKYARYTNVCCFINNQVLTGYLILFAPQYILCLHILRYEKFNKLKYLCPRDHFS